MCACTHTERTFLGRECPQDHLADLNRNFQLYRLCWGTCEYQASIFFFANGYSTDRTSISTLLADTSTTLANSLKGKCCQQLNGFPSFNHLAFKWLEGCAIDLKIPSLRMTHVESKYNPTRYSSEIFN